MEAPLPTTLLVSSFPPSPLWHRQQGQEQKAPHAHHQKRSLPLRCWFRRLKGVWKKGRKKGREGHGGEKSTAESGEREGIFLCHFSPAFVPRSPQATLVIAHWDNAAVPAACGRATGGRAWQEGE